MDIDQPSRLKKKFRRLATIAVSLTFASSSQAANSGITYHGRIVKPSGAALEGSAVTFRLQIRTPNAGNCLLYEEVQTLNMSGSGGVFSMTINDGSGTRSDSTGLGLDRIFANRGVLAGTDCTISGPPYTPDTGDGRRFQVLFRDEAMSSWEPLPQHSLNFVPMAIEAKQVGGFSAEHLLRVEDSTGPRPAAALSPAQFTELINLADGTSAKYLKSSAGGALVPNRNTAPLNPSAGQIWYDTSDNALKFWNGSVIQTISNSIGGQNSIRFPLSDSTVGGSIAIGAGSLTNQDALAPSAFANTAIGYQTLSSASLTTSAMNNTAIGYLALAATTGGAENTAVGGRSLLSNTAGIRNTAVGFQSLSSVTTGNDNTGLGFDTAMGVTSQSATTAVGARAAMWRGADGTTAIGASALSSVGTGIYNTAVGVNAGLDVTSGSNNIIFGFYPTGGVGVTTGSGNILVGHDVRPASQTSNNQLNIGNLIFGTGLGSGPTFATGNVGIRTSSPRATLDVNGGIRAGASTVVTAACDSAIEGTQRYNYSSHAMEFCNGTSWMSLVAQTVGSTATVVAFGPPVSAGIYSFTAVSSNFTPGYGVIATTHDATWPAINTSASGAACLGIPPGPEFVIYDLGANVSIGHLYFSGGYLLNLSFAFSTDNLIYTSGLTSALSGGWDLISYQRVDVNPVQTARYLKVMNATSGGGDGSTSRLCEIAVGP